MVHLKQFGLRRGKTTKDFHEEEKASISNLSKNDTDKKESEDTTMFSSGKKDAKNAISAVLGQFGKDKNGKWSEHFRRPTE